jgi:hypothetical protein
MGRLFNLTTSYRLLLWILILAILRNLFLLHLVVDNNVTALLSFVILIIIIEAIFCIIPMCICYLIMCT